MQDGSIQSQEGTSPGSFDIDMSVLNGEQVGQSGQEGKTGEEKPFRVEIDPRYSNLPEAEGVARTFQSKYDTLNVDFVNAQKELQSALAYKQVWADVLQNDDAFYALVAERKPELISSRDIKTEVTKRLTDKFGEGFKPERSRDEAEREDPGGKDWLYYQELDKIRGEVTGSGKYAKYDTLKGFQQAIEAEQAAEEAKIEQEILDAKQKLNMSDAEVEWNRNWAASLKFEEIVQLSRFIRRFKNAPAMGSVPGAGSVGQSKSRKDFTDSLQ